MNLNKFNTTNLFEATTDLFKQLGITLNSNTSESLPTKDILKKHYKENFDTIQNTYFVGIIDSSIFNTTGMFDNKYSYKQAIEQGEQNYGGLMLFALELTKQPTRADISELTRSFNLISQKMPVALVLKYIVNEEAVISIAISERFKYVQSWRQGEKAGKVIILRDIHTNKTHTGHTRILEDLIKPVNITTYEQLHKHWLQVLDVSILNKKFFQDLSNWYFAAMNEVSFPDDLEKKTEVRNATNLIRLITRVTFIWFIKEKQLVPSSLFRKDYLEKILKDFNKNNKSKDYYNAILQNLFFGTLNQRMDERKFAKEGDINANREEYGVKNLFRYADLFSIPEHEVTELFKDIPFLNGGLFDCLDKPNDNGKIEYVDGFSRNKNKRAHVPDFLFFGDNRNVDLNGIYGTQNKTYITKGLITILESYKFTVAENTPIEEEIALDPELLGKVFENLLASYNPETQTTARKQTGSFYTPREIVNYMVDESLIEYLKQHFITKHSGQLELGETQVDIFGNDTRKGQLKLEAPATPDRWKGNEKLFEDNLRKLFSYELEQPFSDTRDVLDLIEAINNCKILDPACGSGAFPMGILHKMVHILQKLDPENKYWKETQKKKIIGEEVVKLEKDKKAIEGLSDEQVKEKALQAVKVRLDELDEIFNKSYNFDDYSRKLYLIENCIYGIDIQPIAVQISKLRFFISLIIDQKVNKSKDNLGVRSLPNLETKFVAANTLIGLDKPQQTLLRNPEIEVKENELKEMRHKYFTANTRKEKIALQKQDKKLRLEIAKMLENDGWETKVAKQIVAFDPYDQNQSSGWFDNEWMFGMVNGFDIVIGNPPWIQSKVLSIEDKNLYSIFFKTAIGQYDLFNLFIEKGIQILNTKGRLIFITPDRFITNFDYRYVREYLLKNTFIKEVTSLGDNVFENVAMPSAIIHIENSKDKNDNIKCRSYFSTDFSFKKQLDFIDNENFIFKIFGNSDIDTLLQLISSKSEVLINHLTNARGVEIGRDSPAIKFNFRTGLKKFLRGEDIDRYQIKSSVYIDTSFDEINYKDDSLYKDTKILIRKTGNGIKAVIDEEYRYVIQTIYIFKTKKTSKLNERYILGCLNSKLMGFYYSYTFGEKDRKVFPHLTQKKVLNLPIMNINEYQQKPFIEIVDKILSAKKSDPKTDTSNLEKQIDELVYKLYDLTEEEIRIIEGNA